ncbi:MAG: hypothetical protein P8Z76_21170 [Alphaproteobacteria bacterium]
MNALVLLLGPCCLGFTSGAASAGSYYGGGYYGGGYCGGYGPAYPDYGVVARPYGCCNRGFSCYRPYCGYYGPAPAYQGTPVYQDFNGPCPIVLVPDGRGGWV